MSTHTVRVFVTLKPSVFDPQGHTIAEALHSMGHARVADVRQGKYFEVRVEADTVQEAETMVGQIADTLLANPVIESYRLET
jgi:phosphoribosylformylglycinamidine synthase